MLQHSLIHIFFCYSHAIAIKSIFLSIRDSIKNSIFLFLRLHIFTLFQSFCSTAIVCYQWRSVSRICLLFKNDDALIILKYIYKMKITKRIAKKNWTQKIIFLLLLQPYSTYRFRCHRYICSTRLPLYCVLFILHSNTNNIDKVYNYENWYCATKCWRRFSLFLMNYFAITLLTTYTFSSSI